MTTCIHKSHHRPTVVRASKASMFRWIASCPCGFLKGCAFWRQALIAANRHSEELK